MGRRLGSSLALLVSYLGLLVWLTWPLAAHLATHHPETALACRFDQLHAIWALSYATHVLVSAPGRLAGGNIYHPAPHALFYGPAGFGAVPYFAPTFLLTGNPTLAGNVLFLGGVGLSALMLHLVAQRWTGSSAAGFLAAWTLLTTRWTLWTWIPTVPYDAVLLYFPVILFVAARPAQSFRQALVLLPLVVLQCLVESTYVAVAVLAPLGLLALARVARRSTRAAGLRLLGVLVLAVVALLPVYAGYATVRAENPMLPSQTQWTNIPPDTVLSETLLAPDAATAVPGAAMLVALIGGLAFALRARRAAATERAAWAQGACWVLAGTLLSLKSPLFQGGVRIPIPQDLLRGIPISAFLRVPARLAMAALMGLAVLVGLGFGECTRRLATPDRGRWAPAARGILALLVAAAMFAEYRSGPVYDRAEAGSLPASYPVTPSVAPSPIDAVLRAGEGPVLQIPVAPTLRSPGLQARAMYRSIYHWRPILNGYSSYWPAGFPERMALANRLPDPQALATLRRDTGLATVVVTMWELRPPQQAVWRALARDGSRTDLRLVAQDEGLLVFEVAAQPP